MTAFITKHALTRGIFEIEADIVDHAKRTIRQTVGGKGINCYYTGREWWKTKDEAVTQARRMRDEKIKSLKNQIEKLKQMMFV